MHLAIFLCQEFGLKQCGYYATRALRIEKMYAFWGQARYTFFNQSFIWKAQEIKCG